MANPTLGALPCGLTEIGPLDASETLGGAVAPLVAVLLVPVIAGGSYAVDLGHISTSGHATQPSADAAALAGVDKLLASYAAVSGAGNRR